MHGAISLGLCKNGTIKRGYLCCDGGVDMSGCTDNKVCVSNIQSSSSRPTNLPACLTGISDC